MKRLDLNFTGLSSEIKKIKIRWLQPPNNYEEYNITLDNLSSKRKSLIRRYFLCLIASGRYISIKEERTTSHF